MTLTFEQAKAIRQAFGPCTVVYECMDTRELVEEAADEPDLSTFVESLLASEEIHLEQRGNQWSGENEEQFRAEVAEDERFLADVRERVETFLRAGGAA